MSFHLGVVGCAAEKFTPTTAFLAKQHIRRLYERSAPDVVHSGRCPMGGIDVWAEEIASAMGIPTEIFAPKIHNWSAPGGFRTRNIQIAVSSDLLVNIVVAKYPPNFKSMTFESCYHCKGRNQPHIKSGGCWTAWAAKSIGKEAKWIII